MARLRILVLAMGWLDRAAWSTPEEYRALQEEACRYMAWRFFNVATIRRVGS